MVLAERQIHLARAADIGRELSCSPDIETLSTLLKDNAVEHMPIDRFGLAVLAAERQRLNFFWHDDTSNTVQQFTLPLNSETSLASLCLRSGAAVQSNDVAKDYVHHIQENSDSKTQRIVSSVLYSPVFIDNEIGAVLVVQSKESGAYSPVHQDILEALAVFTGLALHTMQLKQDLESAAGTDPLTGVFSHERFLELFSNETDRSRRYGSELSLVIFDVDNLEGVNKDHGRDSGDLVLKTASSCGRRLLRTSDILSRYGGAGFALLLPNTGIEGARVVAERMRKLFTETPITVSESLNIHYSASFGLTSFTQTDCYETITKRAEKALFYAKHTGRNKVAMEKAAMQQTA